MQKHESDMECLKEQYQKDIEEQGKQIENRLKAEVDLYKEDMDAMAEQNRELKDKVEQMGQDMEEKNHEIRRIKVLFCLCVDLICFHLFCFDFIIICFHLVPFDVFWCRVVCFVCCMGFVHKINWNKD